MVYITRTTLLCFFAIITFSSIIYIISLTADKSTVLGSAAKFQFVASSDKKKLFSPMKTQSTDILSQLSTQQKLQELDTDPLPHSASCHDEIFLLIIIASSPDGFTRRNAIRGTWASQQIQDLLRINTNKNVNSFEDKMMIIKTVFLVGNTRDEQILNMLKKEAELYKDIVFGKFEDSYRNLTMKTRLGLKWAVYNCQTSYILKTDDDVFINPEPLIHWLKTQNRGRFYGGWCNFNSIVIRDPNSKWYVSLEDYPDSQYPGYCLGGGYIISRDIAERILNISYGRKLFPMEDLYVGLLIKDLQDVAPKDNRQNFNLVFGEVQGCNYNQLYLAHPVDPSKQLSMFLQSRLAQETC